MPNQWERSEFQIGDVCAICKTHAHKAVREYQICAIRLRMRRQAENEPDKAPMDYAAIADEMSHRLENCEAERLAQVMRQNVTHIPYAEREDLAQEIALQWLRNNPASGAMANVIASTTRIDYWRRHRIRQHYGLDSSLDSPETIRKQAAEIDNQAMDWEANLPSKVQSQLSRKRDNRKAALERKAERKEVHILTSALISSIDYEMRVVDKCDAQSAWKRLPVEIRKLVQKRLNGFTLEAKDRMKLNRYVTSDSGQAVLSALLTR